MWRCNEKKTSLHVLQQAIKRVRSLTNLQKLKFLIIKTKVFNPFSYLHEFLQIHPVETQHTHLDWLLGAAHDDDKPFTHFYVAFVPL